MHNSDEDGYQAALLKDTKIVLWGRLEGIVEDALSNLLEAVSYMVELREQIIVNAAALYSEPFSTACPAAAFKVIIVDGPAPSGRCCASVLKHDELCIMEDLESDSDEALASLFATSARLMYEKFVGSF
ncbi:hypothetical protein B0A49_10258 [Cryomyces minteri]|uniref:Uncharacterized protein n=1 Tax=Cryomyces minteri TaxID=331657 RepID=A0A4U0WT02_9PEZI|nr:hypothetical protein B0A49_10258 [Cryomyces minteri]